MADPVQFTSASARHALPFLFAGQAQREFFVNEALARADMLLHPVVEGEADDPPAAPADGECWLVGAAPTGDWAGYAGTLACHQSGTWTFATVIDGITVFDRSAGQSRRYLAGWQAAEPVSAPAGGTTIDAEARAAIAEIVAALVAAGIVQTA